ncbi:MAG: zinc ribbon domain-containing protein [Candidatus Glassbacteria bacterium]
MPIYEYRCHACGKRIEVLESTSGEKSHECQSCGQPMERIFSTYGVGKASPSTPPSCGGGSCQGGTCPYN